MAVGLKDRMDAPDGSIVWHDDDTTDTDDKPDKPEALTAGT